MSGALTVVHVVGGSDAGWVGGPRPPLHPDDRVAAAVAPDTSGPTRVNQIRGAEGWMAPNPEQGPPDRDEHTRLWVEEIRSNLNDFQIISRLLRETQSEKFGIQNPLASLFGQLPADADVELLLVATTGDGSTQDQAEALADALERHPRALGQAVVARPVVVIVPGMAESAVTAAVSSALTEPVAVDELKPVILGWGSGATALQIGAAVAVIESARPWTLLATKSPYGQVHLKPVTAPAGAAAWLVRYGQPALAYAEVTRSSTLAADPALLDQIDALRTLFSEVAGRRGQPSHAALAAWLRADLRSGEPLAGLAVRAFVEADYRRRLAGRPDNLDVYRRGSPDATVGQLIAAMRADFHSHGAPTDADAWLVGPAVQTVWHAAHRSAHNLQPLDAETTAILGGWIGGPDLTGASLGPLALPTGRVAVLAARGSDRKPSFLHTILTTPLGPTLARHLASLGLTRPAAVALVLGTSPGTDPLTGDPHHGSLHQAVQDAQDAQHMDGSKVFSTVAAHADDCPERAKDAAEVAQHWLESGMVGDVDAVIIAATGPKELTLGIIHAALTFSARRAIPVFLQSHETGRPLEEAADYHRLTGHLGANSALLAAALTAARRFSFDLAAQLTSLTTSSNPLVPAVVSAAEQIAHRLRLLQLEEQWPSHLPAARERAADRAAILASISQLFTSTGAADQARLVHLATEIGRPERKTISGSHWSLLETAQKAYGFNASAHTGSPSAPVLANIGKLSELYAKHSAGFPSILPTLLATVVNGLQKLGASAAADLFRQQP